MTQNPNIYRIDKSQRVLRRISTVAEIIKKIISTSYNEKRINENFNLDNLSSFTKSEINYYLYVFNTEEVVSDWKDFLPRDLTQQLNFIQKRLSLILFIEAEHEIFCLIGGNAYRIIAPFIDHSFGLNTYARIMEPTSDELLSIKSRGITGTRAGVNEQFRENYRLVDFIKFGKIPKEIHLKLCQETTDLHFPFLKKNSLERQHISVGKAFKIKKNANFIQLHKIILELGIIGQIVPNEYLSSYKEISEQSLIENTLRPELINKIFEDAGELRKQNTLGHFEFDFCNPNNIEKFYEADTYRLKQKTQNNGYIVFDEVSDRNDIYQTVVTKALDLFGVNDFFNFKVFLQSVRISCYLNNKITISSSFLFHISTEFSIDRRQYFLIDTKWYILRDSFIEDLKLNTVRVLNNYGAPVEILKNPWNKKVIKKEGQYNLTYDGLDNYYVIDTIIVDSIELCDILYYDDKNLYLIHVKYGFSSNMRELTNQVLIAARRLKENLNSDNNNFIQSIYNGLKNKDRLHKTIEFEEFEELFKKNIIFVLGFTSQLQTDLDVSTNIDRYKSNIARFSLVQCSREMRTDYYDLLIHQIRRE